MAASTGVIGYGSSITLSTTQGGTYTAIAEIVDIDESQMVDKPEFTHLLSDNATNEYKPGMIDPGEVTFNMNFTKAQYNALIGYRRTIVWLKIIDSDGSITGPFSAFWTKINKKQTTKTAIIASVTFQRTSTISFTPAP